MVKVFVINYLLLTSEFQFALCFLQQFQKIKNSMNRKFCKGILNICMLALVLLKELHFETQVFIETFC